MWWWPWWASPVACPTNRRAAPPGNPGQPARADQGAQGHRQTAGAGADERPSAVDRLGGEQADAILETWFSGTEGGNAIADVLFGDYNPSGKLPITFPRSVGQIPTYYNHLHRPAVHAGQTGQLHLAVLRGPNGPLYPFGYGLSYSSFELSGSELSIKELKRGTSSTPGHGEEHRQA
jgi:hypothetical protein